ICVTGCKADNTCADQAYDCIVGATAGFEPSCVLKCPDRHCPSGMTCQDLPANDDAGGILNDCLPTDWAYPMNSKTLGDGCTNKADCVSNDCATNGVTLGWCTTTCTANADCAGTHGLLGSDVDGGSAGPYNEFGS